ncbi:MerR family transcriptional regulator [Psychrobacillus sp. INOP01]|uniref:MerR family transcriptional regulator n=1 Tax=Psychrobacillus sp. INOP01 TaxID=2829187 RepID=UPI001BA56D5D|nr:MerR family transcriptional regulator [Psychrobacillus sp. INOP01]QUG43367.1 MerR family transcriptional regulator [Psychrobacillus sp. INOP01]
MNQTGRNGIYTIQQVSDVTGLSKQVIRKWEERYELVQPERLENGYRTYKEKDVNTLLRVKVLSEKGYSIKQAVDMLEKEPESVESFFKAKQLKFEKFNDSVIQLLEKGTYCDDLELNLILQQSYHKLGLEEFISKVIIPFLKEVGDRWERDEWGEYQEAVSSMSVRDFLIQIRKTFQLRDDAPLVIGACLPEEHHELPIHIILLQFMLRGWKTVLIGASPAPGAIESLVQKLKPSIVILSASTTLPFEKDPKLLRGLDKFASEQEQVEFYIGGSGALNYLEGKELNAIQVTNDIEQILV